jgi:hypothetical protein
MINSLDFSTYTQWSAIATLAFFLLSLLAFLVRWGIKFRLVGVTGFMLVLTGGLFGLSLGLFKNVEVPGSVPYALVYDNGGTSSVISVPENITAPELQATLQQAANRLFSYGRISGKSELVIRARTLIHPKPGVSQPIYVGQVKRSADSKENQIDIFPDKLALIK